MGAVLGIDGGGHKTHAAVISEQGEFLGFGASGSGNHQVRGLEAALEEIGKAARQALQAAGVDPGEVEVGGYCLAGADLPEDYAMLQDAVQGLGLSRVTLIKNDTLAALRAGTSRSWGVVIICGSGFNAAGRAPDGREIVLPGLGPISGDWGGGQALGIEMIRAVMRSWDGRGKATLLTRLVLDHFNLPDETALLSALYHQHIPDRGLLYLVPLLFEAAHAGDEVSCQIIGRLGEEAGLTAATLIRRLGLEKTGVEVVLGGGVFKGKGQLLTETIQTRIHQTVPRARIVHVRYEPVVGAALLGVEALYGELSGSSNALLETSLPQHLRRVQESSLGEEE